MKFPVWNPYESYLNTRDDGYWDEGNQIWYPNEYAYIDMTEKVLFGDPNPIPALELGQSPEEQGEEVITRILARPQCAVHLCWKLWRYFVEPEPSQGLQIALAQKLIGYGYEVRLLLRDIFLSEEFYAGAAVGNQIKDPVELIVGFEKMLEAVPLPNATVSEMLEELGYTLYHPPNIAGWPEPVRSGNRWLSTGGMMFRLNLPAVFTHGVRDVFAQPWRIPDSGHGAPWVAEYPYPEFVNLDVVVPAEVRGEGNFDLLLEALTDRLLPFHALSATQRRALLYHASQVRAGAEEGAVILEMIRQIMALPESQVH
ncbi:MAG: DUF1800 family protein, partial [Verrucomicrobiota bacterium]